MKKFVRIAGFILAGILTVIALGYAIENWRGARAWSAEQARLKQRGEPLVWPDLLPPAPAPADNFAAIPLFDGLFEYQPVKGPDGKPRQQWKGGPVSTRLSELFRLPAGPKSTGKDDPQSETRRTPALDLAETAARFRSSTNFPHVPDSGKPARDILAALESRKAVFDELKVASGRPECRFGVRYEDNVEALLPHLAWLKSAGQMLQIRAVAHLETGNRVAAAEDVHLILRLADAAGSDPILISMLVRLAIESQAAPAFWQGWRDQRWTAEDYQRFQKSFEAVNTRQAAIGALRGERIFGSSLMDLLIRDPARYAAVLSGEDGSQSTGGPGLALRLIPSGWLRQNQASHSRWLDGVIQEGQDAPPGMGLSVTARSIDADFGGPTPYNFIVRLMAPSFSKIFKKADRSTVRCLLVSTTCAIERYRAETGHLPATLADLAPKYLKGPPIDPMDGKPLRYQARSDGQFDLYSVGLDGQDDDGAGASGRGKEPKDWAWPGRLARTDSHTL